MKGSLVRWVTVGRVLVLIWSSGLLFLCGRHLYGPRKTKFLWEFGRTAFQGGIVRMITKITHSVTKREKTILRSNMRPQKTLFRLFFLVVHQNKKTNFGSSFYLSKTEGLGMASIRIANCMELRLVRAWHQPTGCILRSPLVLIPYRLRRIPCDTMCRFHTRLCRD